jgi:hypothetical protein
MIHVEPSPPTPEGLRRVLLLEMAHVGCLGHGKRFQAKLLRLARAGEAWAEKEAAGYAEAIPGRRPLTAVIAEQIRDMAIDHPDRRWSELETLCAIELGRIVRPERGSCRDLALTTAHEHGDAEAAGRTHQVLGAEERQMDVTRVAFALFTLGVAILVYRAGYVRGRAEHLRQDPLGEAEWIELRLKSVIPRWRRVAGWVAYGFAGLLLCLFLLAAFRYAQGSGWTVLIAVWALWFVIFLAVIGLAEWCWRPGREAPEPAPVEEDST